MSPREELVGYLAGALRQRATVDDPDRVAGRVVDCIPYVVEDTSEIETSAMGAPERTFLRTTWITMRVPVGTERVTLPWDADHTGEARPNKS